MATTGAGLRERRRTVTEERVSEGDRQEEEGEKGGEKEQVEVVSKGVGWGGAFCCLMIARYYSAMYNNIHDCDEVFNYWEPLHYLLYKSGFQTWEYSSEFALRSYLYELLHAVFSGPSVLLSNKVQVFYTVRLALGLLSASTEATLVEAANQKFGARVGMYTLMLLCVSSGCFNASTSFLPSTFSMYAITLASALVLLGDRHKTVVAVAAAGVLIGWPFAALAAAPLVIYSLFGGGFLRVFLAGLLTTLCTMVLSVLTDRYFYGRWTSSVVNLVIYNVFSGEGSTLYGVEGPSFYILNAFNNFNFSFLFALMSPSLLYIASRDYNSLPRKPSREYTRLLVAISPLFIWLAFMSLQPHKEERFLYPVYPLICLAAAATIERLHDYLPESWEYHEHFSWITWGVKRARPLILGGILALSYCRTLSLYHGYSAPMQVYRYLPSMHAALSNTTAGTTVCVGSEWYRYPSSFFLPSSHYHVAWLDDGFAGLLPRPFDPTLGGTIAAPPYFNGKNKASPDQFLSDESLCDFLVELKLDRNDRTFRSNDETSWEPVYEQIFLDKELSPSRTRAFFLPWIWEKSNTFGIYRLLRRINKSAST
ncbi:hypothetical protein KC19_5G122400 [Ceratodon purpureus]|uniref:Mannosyltransferase n=1 Tax=Ceratodon purpureus TaxID=3225 RepID=A0A8T0I2U4_CERPU|nr:hypothetical protein KC19_5G122400 [Ceratodon purpureus]